jgi:hypothetical protein
MGKAPAQLELGAIAQGNGIGRGLHQGPHIHQGQPAAALSSVAVH